MHLQEWLTEYLGGTKPNYYNYLAKKQDEPADVDGFLITMSAYYTGKPITVVSSTGIWRTNPTAGDDIVLIHKGGQGFMDTDHGKKTCKRTSLQPISKKENVFCLKFLFQIFAFHPREKNVLILGIVVKKETLSSEFIHAIYFQLSLTEKKQVM